MVDVFSAHAEVYDRSCAKLIPCFDKFLKRDDFVTEEFTDDLEPFRDWMDIRKHVPTVETRAPVPIYDLLPSSSIGEVCSTIDRFVGVG